MDLRPDGGTESLGVMQLQQEGPSPLAPRALHTLPHKSQSRSPYYLLSIICEDQENGGPHRNTASSHVEHILQICYCLLRRIPKTPIQL